MAYTSQESYSITREEYSITRDEYTDPRNREHLPLGVPYIQRIQTTVSLEPYWNGQRYEYQRNVHLGHSATKKKGPADDAWKPPPERKGWRKVKQ